MSNPSERSALCPNQACLNRQHVTKATLIIDTQTVETTYYGYNSEQSKLAASLVEDKPQPPERPQPIESDYEKRWRTNALILIAVVGVLAPLIGIAVASADHPSVLPQPGTAAYNSWQDTNYHIAIVITVVGYIIGAIAAFRAFARSVSPPADVRKGVQEQQAALDRRYNISLAFYRHALDNWQNNYYCCQTCGSRFVAGHQKYVPAYSAFEVLSQE